MKRSDRFAQSNETYQQDMREPHYNTYYQPVGKPPKKKKSKRIFLRILIILTIIIVL
ncbi:MAG: glycosyltransferase, partial [Staphylococcus warneri]|nr:glycosyltransferase [Staphylococcus warneri]